LKINSTECVKKTINFRIRTHRSRQTRVPSESHTALPNTQMQPSPRGDPCASGPGYEPIDLAKREFPANYSRAC